MARINLAAKPSKHFEANTTISRRVRVRRPTNSEEMPHWVGCGNHGRHGFRDRRPSEGGGNTDGINRLGSSGGGGNAGGIFRPGSGGGTYRPASGGGGGGGNESGIYRLASGGGGGGNAGGIYYPGSSGSGNVGGIYGEHNIIIINNFDGGNSGRPGRHPCQGDEDEDDDDEDEDDDDEDEDGSDDEEEDEEEDD